MLLLLTLLLVFSVHATWFEKWMEKDDKVKGPIFDTASTKDFLINTDEDTTVVFSPLASEINVLLQASVGDYGKEIAKSASKYLLNMMKDRNSTKDFIALSSALVPQGKKSLLDNVTTSFSKIDRIFVSTYNSEDKRKAQTVLDNYKKWIEKTLDAVLKKPLDAPELFRDPGQYTRAKRIYASRVYFKNKWTKSFKNLTESEGEFYLKNGETVKRPFVTIQAPAKYYEHNDAEAKGQFKAVSVQYGKEDKDGIRYMIYIIPEDKEAKLSDIWNEFARASQNDLLIGDEEKVELRVPKVEKLKSTVDLMSTQKNVYNQKQSPSLASTMSTIIRSGKKDQTARDTSEGKAKEGGDIRRVAADRPHIVLSYDSRLKRILIAMKDTGE